MNTKEVTLGGISVAAFLYVLFCVFFLGPQVGKRMGMAHHLDTCKAKHADWTREISIQALAKLEKPKNGAEIAIARRALNSPWFKMAKDMSRFGLAPGQQNPLSRVTGIDPFRDAPNLVDEMEEKYQSAMTKYNEAVEAIRQRAANQIGKGGDVCEQAIAKAVGDHAYEWGAYAGSGGLIELEPVQNFRREIQIALREIQKG